MDAALKIFLSYAPTQRNLAKKLNSRLKSEGFETWFADEKLRPGDNWLEKAGKALRKANAMIVLLTPEYVKSPWLVSHPMFAIGSMRYERRIIPVLIRRTDNYPWIFDKMRMIEAKGSGFASKPPDLMRSC